MIINDIVDLGNGMSLLEVVDGSGFIQRYPIVTGTAAEFMKELRESMH